jgi:hypothetical protein
MRVRSRVLVLAAVGSAMMLCITAGQASASSSQQPSFQGTRPMPPTDGGGGHFQGTRPMPPTDGGGGHFQGTRPMPPTDGGGGHFQGTRPMPPTDGGGHLAL